MGRKSSKKTASLNVFGFMINPHEMLIISEEGQKLSQINVDSDSQAKERFMGDVLNQQLISTLGRTDFSTIWVDDPAGDPAVMEACRKMEQGQADQLLADSLREDGCADDSVLQDEQHPEELEAALPEQNQSNEVTVHTKGTVFQTEIDGEFKNIPGHLLKIDDICRFFPEGDHADETLWQVLSSPVKASDYGEEDDWSIQLRKKDSAEIVPEEESPAPQFTPETKTKIIEVECAETYSEQKIKQLGRRIRSLKEEALQTAADYREDIKKLEKQFFEMCEGKSFTQMECTVETDWEAGVRRFIRPDNGKVAKEEQIPYEERQLKMDLPMKDGTPASSEEQVVDESALTPEAVAETTQEVEITEEKVDEEIADDPNDFPPPTDEEEELLNEDEENVA